MTKTSKTKIEVTKPCYYLDHRGRPQRSICNRIHTQRGWNVYELAGTTSKLEGEVFATKDELLGNIAEGLLKLN
jgi:hypothetical protein